MAVETAAGSQYSNKVAYIYIFNLIVGVGALNLPGYSIFVAKFLAGFQAAGLVSFSIHLLLFRSPD